MHGFDYIRGLFVFTSMQPVADNGQKITQLVEVTAHENRGLRRNVEISGADGHHRFAAVKKLN